MAKSVPHRGLPTDQRGVLVVQMRLPTDTGRFVAGSIQTGIKLGQKAKRSGDFFLKIPFIDYFNFFLFWQKMLVFYQQVFVGSLPSRTGILFKFETNFSATYYFIFIFRCFQMFLLSFVVCVLVYFIPLSFKFTLSIFCVHHLVGNPTSTRWDGFCPRWMVARRGQPHRHGGCDAKLCQVSVLYCTIGAALLWCTTRSGKESKKSTVWQVLCGIVRVNVWYTK